ncbi:MULTISPECIES: hypothetical protein [unclassified Devosia]|uniref:hypothetical protein n=1 Tax=unclassified Devosia TaxID=196773 RepID=UPI0015564163|nr:MULTISPECIES: hypothetical protein [unclassified Devosia]
MEVQSGPSIWLILLTIGVIALALAVVFGIMRNRNRSSGEKAVTEAATRATYQAEDRDRT